MKPLPAYIMAMGVRSVLLKDKKVISKGQLQDLPEAKQKEIKSYEEGLPPLK
jgi:ABC-type transporter Mla maintaining outer membrane lipid asymmetry ATPase subunit MlaF